MIQETATFKVAVSSFFPFSGWLRGAGNQPGLLIKTFLSETAAPR